MHIPLNPPDYGATASDEFHYADGPVFGRSTRCQYALTLPHLRHGETLRVDRRPCADWRRPVEVDRNGRPSQLNARKRVPKGSLEL
jgi:hypothetical protein